MTNNSPYNTEKGNIELPHACTKEVMIALMEQSIKNTENHTEEIKNDQKEILKQLAPLPERIKGQDKSIGRLWKFIYVALGGAVASVANAVAGKF